MACLKIQHDKGTFEYEVAGVSAHGELINFPLLRPTPEGSTEVSIIIAHIEEWTFDGDVLRAVLKSHPRFGVRRVTVGPITAAQRTALMPALPQGLQKSS